MRVGTLVAATVITAVLSTMQAPLPAAAELSNARDSSIVVASFNVCKVNCASPAPGWNVRRERVQRVIVESGVDVVGLQEATNHATDHAETQVQDIANLTAPYGYMLPSFPRSANECRRPRGGDGRLSGPSPCDNTAALLFNSSRIQQAPDIDGRATAGIVQAGSIVPGLDERAVRRSVAWAILQRSDGSKPFLAISLHTDSDKDPAAEASRVALAQGLSGWATALTASQGWPGIPIILLADLNSYEKRQPAGAQAILTRSGWVDAFSAPTRRNIQYSTINYNPRLGANQGFPSRPYTFRISRKNPLGAATRIDYVMAYGSNLRFLDYEVVIRLDRTGRFVPDYQASDHQMVRATVQFID